MKTSVDMHQTNDKVEETGSYICTSGETVQLSKGDTFPKCPNTGTETTWRHLNHQHTTGEIVTEAGHYQDKDGQHVDLNLNDTFPACPKTGESTFWHHL